MELEWDERKRQRTLEDRGLDFAALVRFDWATAKRMRFQIRSGEFRRLAVGRLEDEIVVIVYVVRDQKVRIISMRKASAQERGEYAARTTD